MMEALGGICSQGPEWLRKLELLSAEIDERQVRFASQEQEQPKNASEKASSTGNSRRPSNESLHAQQGPANTSAEPSPTKSCPPALPLDHPASVTLPLPSQSQSQLPSPSPVLPVSQLLFQEQEKLQLEQQQRRRQQLQQQKQQKHEQETKALRPGRLQVKRKQKTASIATLDDEEGRPNGPKMSRGRTMVVVYYDSYVQDFFEELVKFISVRRNQMRKAKMAAKVAQIIRMVDDEPAEGNASAGKPSAPASSRAGKDMFLGNFPDVYAQIDKQLETVQTLCEKAAHCFLREGYCDKEINAMRETLGQGLKLAQKELERLRLQEAQTPKDTETVRPRTLRPAAMRRDAIAAKKKSSEHVASSGSPLSPDSGLPASSAAVTSTAVGNKTFDMLAATAGTIEAASSDDEANCADDYVYEPIQFRSTRASRPVV